MEKLYQIGPGCEDIEHLRIGESRFLVTGTATRGTNWFFFKKKPRPDSDQIRGIDLSAPGSPAVTLWKPGEDGPAAFHPVGIFARRESELYVINEPPKSKDDAAVEVFAVEGDALKFQRTIKAQSGGENLFSTANGIAVRSDEVIYVTNLGLLKFGAAPPPSIVDGAKPGAHSLLRHHPEHGWKVVMSPFYGANGAVLKPESEGPESILYVAAYFTSTVYGLELDPSTGDVLRIAHEIKIPDDAHPDNLSLGDDGYVYVAAQHGTIAAIKHLVICERARLRGSVYRFPVNDPPAEAEKVDVEIPDSYRAPSTALRLGDSLFLSQVVGNEILAIDLPD